MNTKKGITLTALTIMIVVMAILITIIIESGIASKNNAKNIAFLEEIKKIEDEIKKQFVLTGNLPIDYKNINGITLEELTNKLGEDKKGFVDQVNKKNDQDEKFIKIDLKKLGVKNTTKGLGKVSDKDYFYLTKKSLNVYYLQGIKIEKVKIYTNVEDNTLHKEEELSYMQLKENLDIEKKTKTWSKKVDFNIKTNVANDQKMYINILDSIGNKIYEKDITQNARSGVFAVTEDLAENNIILKASKIVFIKKDLNSTEISSKEFELANLDINEPVIIDSKTKVKKQDKLIAQMYFLDFKSGVDKFIYLPKSEVNNMTEEEILQTLLLKGKEIKAKKSSGENEYEIYIEDEVLEYVGICVDKSLNFTNCIYIN